MRCERSAVPATNGKIAFTSDRDGDDEIYVMNPDGTGQTNLSATAAAADLNGSGTVKSADFAILRARLNTGPGPSGLACAGTVPCP